MDDNGGAYVVPAFSGLFTPYWRSDARGAIIGLTRYVREAHLCRSVLQLVAYQTRDLVEAMNADDETDLTELKVDGGMVVNELLMQFRADQLGVDVVRPKVTKTTALGAAYAAGIAVGFWDGEQDVIYNWAEDKRWAPTQERDEGRPAVPQLAESGRAHSRLGRRGHHADRCAIAVGAMGTGGSATGQVRGTRVNSVASGRQASRNGA